MSCSTSLAGRFALALVGLICGYGCYGPPLAEPEDKVEGALVAHQAEPLAPRDVLSRTKAATRTEVAASPVALTASDGTGLQLQTYRAKGFIEGPLALTELHLTFKNPHPRVMEGRFEITLPENATISRFAMLLSGGWQEAEVVERQRARQAYEDFLHRRQDPALLEKKAGNRFRARIFPIQANSTKEIIIGYSQEFAAASSEYRLTLRGLPLVGEVDIAVWNDGRRHHLNQYDFAPQEDFIVRPEDQVQGLRHENLAVVRLTPAAKAAREAMDELLVLVDTSASRALDFSSQVQALGKVLERIKSSEKRAFKLQVACFDQQIAEIFEGQSDGF